MGGVSTLFGGGQQDDAAKALEKEQKKAAAAALQQKVVAIQDSIGARTMDLIRRYGGIGRSGGSPLG